MKRCGESGSLQSEPIETKPERERKRVRPDRQQTHTRRLQQTNQPPKQANPPSPAKQQQHDTQRTGNNPLPLYTHTTIFRMPITTRQRNVRANVRACAFNLDTRASTSSSRQQQQQQRRLATRIWWTNHATIATSTTIRHHHSRRSLGARCCLFSSCGAAAHSDRLINHVMRARACAFVQAQHHHDANAC